MRLIRVGERGLTLWEVIIALFLTGIILTVSLRLMTEQWRGGRGLSDYLEAHYAVLTAGETVSDAIRKAETVEWMSGSETLRVLPLPDDGNPVPRVDTYFIADLDRNGIMDLYWGHLGVSSPLASYLTKWKCTEVEEGLWEIFLEADVKGQKVVWRGVMRRRIQALS